MKMKNLTFGLFAVLALVLIAGLASAASLAISNVVTPTDVEHDDGSFDIKFDLTNSGIADPAISFVLSMTTGTATMTKPSIAIADGSITPQTVHLTATIDFPEQQSGNLVGKIIIDDQGGGSPKELDFNVAINDKVELTITKTTDLTKTQNGVISIKNTGNVKVNDIVLSDSGDFDVTLSQTTDFDLNANEEKVVTVTAGSLSDLNFGDNTVTVTATGTEANANIVLTIFETFCEAAEIGGNLDIRDISIDNQGEGKDNEWQILDTIEIEVEVENNGNEDVKDVFVELGLFDGDGNDVTSDIDFDNSDEEQIDVGRLNEDDKETAVFTFKVPADFEDGNYKLAIKAYSDDLGEDTECTDTSSDLSDTIFEKISVDRESDSEKFISFQNVVLTPSQATCGEIITLTADVYNIGDEDQDQVKVSLISSELGINQFVEIRNDLDQGDKETVTFEFQVPNNLANTNYYLNLLADYDYNNGNYRETSDEPTKVGGLLISGCSGGGVVTGNIASINAVLDSEAVAGEELVVRASITSLKDETTTFVISALDYEDWSTLSDISERIITLDAGESQDVTLKFNVDADVSGEKSFLIEVRAGDQVQTREVAVNISGGTTGGITGFAALGEGNSLIWVIGIINVVLIVLIIVVAVRISRR